MKVKELPAVREQPKDFDELEERLKEFFKREIYFPILAELKEPKTTLQNAVGDSLLAAALRSGKIVFSRGRFSGKFNASLVKELRRLGAEWMRQTQTFRLESNQLPQDIRFAVSASQARFDSVLDKIDQKLAKILPEEIAGKIKSADLFDRALWKTNRSVESSLNKMTVAPTLTSGARKVIADEWQNNLKLHIKDFTGKEIQKLRKSVQRSTFAGNRYDSLLSKIQTSYGVSANKAKFLARQETGQLLAKFKKTRYLAAGCPEYRWQCVAGTKAHPVRPSHKKLDGKIFRWDNPPMTSNPGEPARYNNPGEDFGCRCGARPVVRFK